METESTDNGTRRVRRERSETVSDISSTAPFAVDDGSGQVLVNPEGAEMDDPERVADRFDRATARDQIQESFLSSLFRSGNDSGTIGFQHEEWIIRPDTRLYVQGEVADRTGALIFEKPRDGGDFIISTRSEEEIVKGAEQAAKLAFAGAAVALVAGIGLSIAGALAL
jgi:hypothetical protein